jgi:hypothetical protein
MFINVLTKVYNFVLSRASRISSYIRTFSHVFNIIVLSTSSSAPLLLYLNFSLLEFACLVPEFAWQVKIKVKVKLNVNFTLEQTTKAQKGSISIALLFP